MSLTPSSPGPYNLQTVDLAPPVDGRAPEMRLSDATKAQALVTLLVDANIKRAEANSRVKGALDGNPPFNQAELNKNGQKGRTNINFREAEGIKDSAQTPHYDLFAESPYYFEVQCEGDNEGERIRYSKIITTKFDQMLKKWDAFDYNMQLNISEMIAYGRGHAMWPDTTSWQFDTVQDARVYVPDMTSSSIDKLSVIVITDEWPLEKAWGYIRDKDSARSAGWNTAAMSREMMFAVPENERGRSGTEDYEFVQQMIRNNDIYESARSQVMPIAHVLVKEFDNKITHLIVSRYSPNKLSAPNQLSNNREKGLTAEFLFKKVGRFDSFRQVICTFFYDIGDGKWHSVKGLLVKMYPFIALKDRANCALVDNFFLNMSVLVQARNPAAIDNVPMLQIGPLTVLSPDVELQQWGMSGRMEEGLAIDRHLENKLATNIGQYRQTARREQGNPETATKVMADQSKEAMLTKGAINRFYSQLDFLGEEVFRRASNTDLEEDDGGPNSMALEFQEACVKAGCPKKWLKKIRSVRAWRNIGNGSIFMRQHAFQMMMPLVPMMNEEGRMNWLEDAIASNTNQEMVARYAPRGNQQINTAEDMKEAMMENAVMKVGAKLIVAPTDMHVIHADVHLKAGADAVTATMNGGDIFSSIAFLENVGPHVQLHLEQIQADGSRSREYAALSDTHKQLAQATNQLVRQAQQIQAQQQQAAQAQQQAMSDEQRKDWLAQRDAARKDAKQANQMELNRVKTEQKLAINDTLTANKIQNERRLDMAATEP